MNISGLKGKLPNEIIESVSARGIRELTPPQEDAIRKGLLEGKNMLIASPTASGKTLVAEIACVNSILSKGRKAIYIAPMRALATEKYNEFKETYPYINAAISIGDLDSNDLWLKNYKMLFFSTEKFDSLLRHGIDWLQSIGCIIFDEVHMLGDMSRGPTLELLITKLSMMCDAQIISLSATIGNPEEIAKWSKAELVVSDYRPVKLLKGVLYDASAYYNVEDELKEYPLSGMSKLPEVRLAEDTLEQRKQLLIFYSTKKSTEVGATRLAQHVRSKLSREDIAELENASASILNALDRPTEQCAKLSSLVCNGVAFHHSGLLNKQRAAIENAFKSNLIKVICATTTLGYGVNLPAHTVLIRDISRYENGYSERLGINEVTQLFGRAGRPKYDREGRALISAGTKDRVMDLARYIETKPDSIDSALGVAPILRTHILSFIAENFLNEEKAMQKFLSRSFYSFQYGNQGHINSMIKNVVDELCEWEFIDINGSTYSATKLGRRVSELYIDPLSAKWIVDSLRKELDLLGILYMISNTLEMRPHVRMTKEALSAYVTYLYMNDSEATKDYIKMEYDSERAFSTALMLRDWMEEQREPEIVKKYSSTPGALYSKITNADWLIYSAVEMAKILKRPQHRLIEARVRLRYGIKEELLDLVRLEQIGRVRARALYANGIRKVSDIEKNREKVKTVLGNDIAERVFSQLG
ncbi:MAG: DEAD/DEAH box helicase [Candidatus Micrarchaeota archaeon]|nr:DEAD/DEAH box helicase [Candidatus Micrarchaeota archaeon]